MSFEFTVTAGAEILPPGQYAMRFVGVEQQPAKPGGEPYLKWKWDRQTPDGTCLRWTSMSSTIASAGSKARGWLEGMLGRGLTNGEKIDPRQFENQWFHVLVIAKTKQNGSVGDDIANAWPYEARAAAPPPAPTTSLAAAPRQAVGAAAVAAVRATRPLVRPAPAVPQAAPPVPIAPPEVPGWDEEVGYDANGNPVRS